MGPRSPEGKAANKIIDAIDVMSIDEHALAYMLYNSSSRFHDRLYRIFMHLLKRWAKDYDDGVFDEHNQNTLVNSKRIVELMKRNNYM